MKNFQTFFESIENTQHSDKIKTLATGVVEILKWDLPNDQLRIHHLLKYNNVSEQEAKQIQQAATKIIIDLSNEHFYIDVTPVIENLNKLFAQYEFKRHNLEGFDEI